MNPSASLLIPRIVTLIVLFSTGTLALAEIYPATESNGGPTVMKGAPISIDASEPSASTQRIQTDKSAPKGWNQTQNKSLRRSSKKANTATTQPRKQAKAAATAKRPSARGNRIQALEKDLTATRNQLALVERELEIARSALANTNTADRVTRRGRQARLTPPSELLACIQPGKGNYDPVRADQADTVAARLALVETLILRFNRAYDYRVHTTRELKTILSELDRHGDALPPAPVR